MLRSSPVTKLALAPGLGLATFVMVAVGFTVAITITPTMLAMADLVERESNPGAGRGFDVKVRVPFHRPVAEVLDDEVARL